MTKLLSGIAVSMLSAASLFGQVSANVTGLVVDSTGAAIPNATVSLQLPGSASALYTTTSSSDGHFALQSVAPGTYDVTIEKQGFQKLKLSALKVDAARETALPPSKLDVATVTASVEVTDAAQAVQI